MQSWTRRRDLYARRISTGHAPLKAKVGRDIVLSGVGRMGVLVVVV